MYSPALVSPSSSAEFIGPVNNPVSISLALTVGVFADVNPEIELLNAVIFASSKEFTFRPLVRTMALYSLNSYYATSAINTYLNILSTGLPYSTG